MKKARFSWHLLLERVERPLPERTSPAVDSELFSTLHEAVRGQ